MKVLLPVDGIFDAKFIIDFISNYRWLRGTQFKLLHVINVPAQRRDAKKIIRDSQDLLDGLIKKVERHLPESLVEREITAGHPIEEIIRQAQSWEANMIVMGYRTRHASQQQYAGSVSRGVTLSAPCSVVVIRPPAKHTSEASITHPDDSVLRQA